MIARLIAALFPPLCGICGRACVARAQICSTCATGLRSGPSPRAFVPRCGDVWSLGPHEGVIRDLALALKYRARLGLAEAAALAIAEKWSPTPGAELVPIPPAPARHRARGYDPAAEVASALAETTGLPLRRCLTRTDGHRQVGRTRSQRRADPPSIAARSPAPRHAVLVDDVLTTGATLQAAAQALRQSGAETIEAITIARA